MDRRRNVFRYANLWAPPKIFPLTTYYDPAFCALDITFKLLYIPRMSDPYSALGASPPATDLPAAPQPIASPAELRSYEPSLSEKIKGHVQDFLMRFGANPQVSEHLAGGLTSLAQFIPPVGMATAVSDMQRSAQAGNIPGTLTAAVGAIPGVGPEVRVAKTILKAGEEAKQLGTGVSRSLSPANQNVSQAAVKAALPGELSIEDRTWQNYASKVVHPDEVLSSEALWGGAARIAERDGISNAEAFSYLANDIWKRMGANKFITPQMAQKHILEERTKFAVPAVERIAAKHAENSNLLNEATRSGGRPPEGVTSTKDKKQEPGT